MKNILFICHGNICRSPAAEYLLKSKLAMHPELSSHVQVISRATSREELGHPIDSRMHQVLRQKGIDASAHRAQQVCQDELESADYLFVMDQHNERNLKRKFDLASPKMKTKIQFLADLDPDTQSFPDRKKEISDPWYTLRFDAVVAQIDRAVTGLLHILENEHL